MVAVKHAPDVQRRDFDLEPRSLVRNDPRDFEIEPRDIVLSENAGQFYDEEFDVAILTPHRLAYRYLNECLEDLVAAEAGLAFFGDHPVWYQPLEPEAGDQKTYSPDISLLEASCDPKRPVASLARFVLEVVSTHDKRKERKDTVRMKALNELNRVPEFLLVFPDSEDHRNLMLWRWNPATELYDLVMPDASGRLASTSVPGLVFKLRDPNDWSPGRKFDAEWRGVLCTTRAEDRAMRQEAQASAEKERLEKERLAAKLRSLGIDPEA